MGNPKIDPWNGAFPGSFGEGLTKREYFAAALMSGAGRDSGNHLNVDAARAVVGADALIAALNRGQEENLAVLERHLGYPTRVEVKDPANVLRRGVSSIPSQFDPLVDP